MPIRLLALLAVVTHFACSTGSALAQPGQPRSVQPRATQQAAPQARPPQQQAARPQQGAGAVPGLPPVPFVLTAQEEQILDQALAAWEARSAEVQSMKCKIYRWEYDNVFNKVTESEGEMKYRAPDKGLYRVTAKDTGSETEHWICDGKSIFEFNYEKKLLIERVLPQELQGKAISNGPLPFLFGAQAETLKRRYYLRLIAPPAGHEDKICIEAYPKLREDAANFLKATFMMHQKDWLPFALQLDLPNGKNQTVHRFEDVTVNGRFDFLQGDFAKPKAPLGWKKVIEDPQVAGGELPPTAPAAEPRGIQARQTVPVPQRN